MHRLFILPFFVSAALHAETCSFPAIETLKVITCKSGDAQTDYERSRGKLDVYLPKGGGEFATLVWFHGGIASRIVNADDPARIAILGFIKTNSGKH